MNNPLNPPAPFLYGGGANPSLPYGSTPFSKGRIIFFIPPFLKEVARSAGGFVVIQKSPLPYGSTPFSKGRINPIPPFLKEVASPRTGGFLTL